MKKLMSAILALAMVVSLASVSFALPTGFSTGGILGPRLFNEKNDYVCRPKGLDSLESDYWVIDNRGAEYGSTIYLELLHAREIWEHFSLDMIRNMKVKAEWEEGGDLVESVSVEVVRSLSWNQKNSTYEAYYPALVIKLKESTDTTETDLVGTVTLNKRKGDQEYRIKDAEIQVQFAVGHFYNYVRFEDLLIDHDQQIIYPGDLHLLKFDYDDEVELTFGSEPNEGTFTVDVSGQGKVLMLFDTIPNAAVEAANPRAKMIFLGFNHVKFNRTGEFFYETETGRYLYELIDGMPVEIKGAEYDEADKGLRFYTRILGNYVISDIPLLAPDPAAAKAAAPNDETRLNPVTSSRRVLS